MKILTKVLSTVLLCTMLLVLSNPVTANAQTQILTDNKSITVDLEEFDIEKEFSQTTFITDQNGNEGTFTLSYTPLEEGGATVFSTNPASVGTWTSTADFTIFSMSYRFDLTKSGNEWRISNARDHYYGGVFVSFANPSLEISRAISTPTFPAEINARVDVSYFDNGWFHLYTNTWLMNTTVTSGGIMTITTN